MKLTFYNSTTESRKGGDGDGDGKHDKKERKEISGYYFIYSLSYLLAFCGN